jgi:ribosomal protein L11 methyltransferase
LPKEPAQSDRAVVRWVEVSLSVAREQVDEVELLLQQQGALAITLLDKEDQPVLEPAPGTVPLWPQVKIVGLFSAETNKAEVSQQLLAAPAVERPDALFWHDVADQDWERAWMDRFQSMQFGQHLWIVPSGMQAPDDPQAIVLKLDPGLAFGTGTHPTTALCLDWIDAREFRGQRILDFGCGSGVLGIAGALKGANTVFCVDNDPQALAATRDNAERNKVSGRVTCLPPEAYEEQHIDVVLANILARPLIELKSVLLRGLRSGGCIVLSGILQEQAEGLADIYRPHCSLIKIKLQQGWARIEGVLA